MLPTRLIPIYEDDPANWHTFLYKAAKGSIKAVETVCQANLAYMVAITGEPTAPETMQLDDFKTAISSRFPKSCPAGSIQEFYEIALQKDWIATPFFVSSSPRNSPAKYVGLWGRMPVRESALINDAMLYCLEKWSPANFMDCLDHDYLEYDSRIVTAAMLYLSITWP